MRLDTALFEELLRQAEASPRGRMHRDLRTSPADTSQRMLNVLTRGTEIPVHRHPQSSETVVVCRGAVCERLYGDDGRLTAEHRLEAGGECPAFQVPRGVYHTCVCLSPWSAIIEAKDGAYDPAATGTLDARR